MANDAEARGYWGLGGRACDTCHGSPALLFCRADSAFLCGACDSRVHAANRLSSRHARVWVCEVCEQSPAVVTCKADAAALCSSCDADIHSANPLARRHDRSPIVPFFDTPSSAIATCPAGTLFKPSDKDDENDPAVDEAEAASWILPNPNPKSADLFFADVDPYLDLEYTDSVVPVQTKPIPPPIIAADHGCIELDFGRSKASFNAFSRSVSSSEVGVVPEGTTMADVTNPYGGVGKVSTALDREARVMRYREKRKNRRFEKTIRYASRKAYAETRPRIKGRFAKRSEIEPDVDHLFSPASAAAAAAALMVDPGYGVVPSF